MNKRASDKEIRGRLDRCLRPAVRDQEWTLLELEGYVGEIRDALTSAEGEAAIDECVQSASAFLVRVRASQNDDLPRGARTLHAGGRAGGYDGEEQVNRLTREDVMSMAVAGLARQDPEVLAFRNEVLGGRVIRYMPGVAGPWHPGEWIEQQVHHERAALEQLDEHQLPLLTFIPFDSSATEDALPGLRSVPVLPGGVLDRLRQIANHLAAHYLWTPEQAIFFVLTDVTPAVPMLSAHVDWHEDVTSLTRISMRLDPSLTPRQVSEAYRRIRQQLVPTPPRQMDQRTLWLVQITATRPQGASLESLMAYWNLFCTSLGEAPLSESTDEVPAQDWTYSDVQAFARARRDAVHRLLHPAYRPPTRPDGTAGDEVDSVHQ